jgi:hypothetical protein
MNSEEEKVKSNHEVIKKELFCIAYYAVELAVIVICLGMAGWLITALFDIKLW